MRRRARSSGTTAGKIVFVGISYGPQYVTPQARAALRAADAVVGHAAFVDQVRGFIRPDAVCRDASPDGRDFLAVRAERFRLAYEAASRGDTVVCVSSGDPGIFATMTDFYREMEQRRLSIAVEVVPGITAAQIAAARIGGPLLNGFCLLSLCDDLIASEEIERKVEAAARGDMATLVYKLRYNAEFHPDQYPVERYPQFHPPAARAASRLAWLAETFATLKERSVPVILAQRLGSKGEALIHTDLERLPSEFSRIDFTTLLFVGTSRTRCISGRWVTL